MITFRAQCYSTTEYLQKNNKKKYIPTPASFVEINYKEKEDLSAIIKTSEIWRKNNDGKTTFASEIAYNAYYYHNKPISKIYALTKQMNDFKNLIPEKILAIMEVLPRDNFNEILLLQVDPLKNFEKKLRECKNIGSAFIQSFIKMFPKKDIILEPLENAREFYLKQGFENQVLSRLLRYYA